MGLPGSRLPAPAGGGVEVLACIVPGREPCFFLPGTPRWRLGARGLSSREPGGLGRRAEAEKGGKELRSRKRVSGTAAPETHQEAAAGGRKSPQSDGSRLRTSHRPQSVGAKRETMPTHRPGPRRAIRIDHLSGRSRAAEQREAGLGSSTSEAAGRPSPARPDPLLTVGAFEGIFRPLEIGRHLGGRLSSPGVSELLSGPGRERRRRGTSARFHAPRQQSPAPSRPETERKEPRDPRTAAPPPPRPRM